MSADYALEKQLLDQHSTTYRYNSPQDDLIRNLAVRTFVPFIKNAEDTAALEIGCSNGLMTELWASHFSSLDVAEGSEKFIAMAKQRNLHNVQFHHTLLEDYETDKRYDYIIAGYVLPIVIDEQVFLKKIRELLKPDGTMYVVVSNARSLSRQLAKHMGLIDDEMALMETDIKHGHRRIYDRHHLDRALATAGFNTVKSGGIFLKKFADFQMDELIRHNILQDAQIEGLYSLGNDYPDICGALYSVCQHG